MSLFDFLINKIEIHNKCNGYIKMSNLINFDIEIVGMIGQHPSITDHILNGGLLQLKNDEPVVHEIEKIFSKIIT